MDKKSINESQHKVGELIYVSMISDLCELNKQHEIILSTTKSYVQDSQFDFDKRWNVFIKAGELGLIPTDSCYFEPEGLDWNKTSLYDDFYIDKYQTYDVKTMLEHAIENKLIENDEDIIKFKESCMTQFIYSAENDW